MLDPDIFAVGDVYDLLTSDMGEWAILCRRRTTPKGTFYASERHADGLRQAHSLEMG